MAKTKRELDLKRLAFQIENRKWAIYDLDQKIVRINKAIARLAVKAVS